MGGILYGEVLSGFSIQGNHHLSSIRGTFNHFSTADLAGNKQKQSDLNVKFKIIRAI